MASKVQRITPCLWFDSRAEEAAGYYTSIFPNSKITATTHYGPEAAAASGQPVGSVLTVAFQLDGEEFLALNGGPIFKFTEAVSLIINCASQAEIDHYWDKLTAGGDPSAQVCGWLKDKFGLSWQVVPTVLNELLSEADPVKSGRVMAAMLKMSKLDLAALQRAAVG